MLWKCLPWVSSCSFWGGVPCRVCRVKVWSCRSLSDFLPEVPTGTGASWKTRLWMAQNQARNMEHVTQLNSLKSTLLVRCLKEVQFMRHAIPRFFKRVVLHCLLCATVVPLIAQKVQFTLVMMSCSNNSWRLQAQQSTNQLAAATLVAAAVVVVVAAVAAGLAASSRSRWPLWSVTILVDCYWDISPIQQCTDSDQSHYISMISLTFW